jgi:hypothetical protein
MKTKASIMMITVVLVCMLAALPSPAQATAPEPLAITANLWLTGENSAAGSFGASGLFTDAGSASEIFHIADSTTHGTKTLVGATGTITIKFQAQITWTSATTAVAIGRFNIISGTGAYEKLHGIGKTYAALNLVAGTLDATYTGKAHFD